MTDIVENEQLPAWLVELRDQQITEQSQPQPPVAEEPVEEAIDWRTQMAEAEAPMPFAEEQEEPVEEAPPVDLLDDLREQMILEDDVFEDEQRASATLSLTDLKPAKRLLLAVLLFMNVTVCGCMILIMAGRVELPF